MKGMANFIDMKLRLLTVREEHRLGMSENKFEEKI
jgi:hypothetical protein